MIKDMTYRFLIFAFLFFSAVPVFAYVLEKVQVNEPYEIVEAKLPPEEKQLYVGKLNGFPVMYKVNADKPFKLHLELRQPKTGVEPKKLSLLVVRQNENNGGVTEVARQPFVKEDWRIEKDKVLGLTFFAGEPLAIELDSGTYKIEVSAPDNIGDYLLTIGNKDTKPVGYWGTLKQVRTVQSAFGYSLFRMLASSYVYYPLGIIVLLFLIHRTWRWRKTFGHA